jgi:hypothetical protein
MSECYICYEIAHYKSPCICQHYVHRECLRKAISKGFKTCGICQGEYRFFQWTPVYLRTRESNNNEYLEEFFRSTLYIGIISYATKSPLKGGLWWMAVCTVLLVMRRCNQIRRDW